MSPSKLSKNPTLVTLVLSVAALAGYAAYRLTIGAGEPPGAAGAMGHGHAGEPHGLLDSLPEIVLSDLEGNATPLGSFSGKPRLINYWATWCAPCLREIPLLMAFQERYPEIEVIGIAADRFDPVVEFAAEMQFNYPVLVDETIGAAPALGVHVVALPFSVFVSADDAVLGIHAGELHQEHLDNLAETLTALEAGRIDRQTSRERLAGLR